MVVPFNKQIPATADAPTEHFSTPIVVSPVKGCFKATTSEISAKRKHNGTNIFDSKLKTKEMKLDRVTPTTKLLTFLRDDAINSHVNRSNGRVTVPDNTVRSALNNFPDEKTLHTIFHSK